MEIERKFLLDELPSNINEYKSTFMKQGYISRKPTIRLREVASDTTNYILTVKGPGAISREEFELNIPQEQFEDLWKLVSGNIIEKTRYYIPLEQNSSENIELVCEVDAYHNDLEGKYTVEVEFPNLDTANDFIPPSWFGLDVSKNYNYSNSNISLHGFPTE